MENTRLKVRIGVHEFDAEGPPEQISAQFAAWKELLTLIGHAGQPASTTNPVAGSPALLQQPLLLSTETENGKGTAHMGAFQLDERRKLVTLKVHPQGDDRNADAALLILYGFKHTLGSDEVLVGRLKESMEASGLRPERMDRTVVKYTSQNLILKNGRGPGGKYRLSTTGHARAETLAKKLAEQLV